LEEIEDEYDDFKDYFLQDMLNGNSDMFTYYLCRHGLFSWEHFTDYLIDKNGIEWILSTDGRYIRLVDDSIAFYTGE